jgi:diadenosine tetraphosphate (Ap4A) HIT family hydrolase
VTEDCRNAARVYEDDLVTLDEADFCAIPGYLVLRVKGPQESMSELEPDAARHVGYVLSRAARVLERAAGADRVYILSFAEVDRRLHFHLFPRTPAMQSAYAEELTVGSDPLNGPLLFEWARHRYPAGSFGPEDLDLVADVRRAIAVEFVGN